MMKVGALASLAAVVGTASAQSQCDGHASLNAFRSGLTSYCTSDYASCSSGCRSFLTRQFGSCPSLAQGLSDADMSFIVDTCGMQRPQTSKPDGVPPAAGAGTGFYSLSAIDIEGNTVDFSRYQNTVSLIVNVAQF